MSMPMLAGVGLMMVCCSSSSAAMMMGGGEETPDPVIDNNDSDSDEEEAKKEVFHIGGYTYGKNQAEAGCEAFDAQLATDAQFTTAYEAGANWCSAGWVADADVGRYPITEEASFRKGCGGTSAGIRKWNKTTGPERNKAGLNCYGVKPEEGTEKVARFNTAKYSRYE
jgi:hypothetical protein